MAKQLCLTSMLRKRVASEQTASEHPPDSDPLPAEPEFSELEPQGSQITCWLKVCLKWLYISREP